MALTPDEIASHSFTPVRRHGLDPAEVRQFLGRIADQLAEQQDALLRAGVAIDQLSSEAAQRPVPDRVDPETVGKWVGQILDQSEATARGVVAEAEADASLRRDEADQYAARVRAEVDEMRSLAEDEVDVFRRDTLAHAAQIRTEAAQTLETMQLDAEARIREIQRVASADLEARLQAVRTAERAMLERLVATADDVSSALRRFHPFTSEAATALEGPSSAANSTGELPAGEVSDGSAPLDAAPRAALAAPDLRTETYPAEAVDHAEIDLRAAADEPGIRATHLRPVSVGPRPESKVRVDLARYAAWDGPATARAGG